MSYETIKIFQVWVKIFRVKELKWLFLALTLAISSLSSVTFLADRFHQSFERDSKALLASDGMIRGDRPIPQSLIDEAERRGLRTALTTIFPTMARIGKNLKLISLKSVTMSYPLRGALQLSHHSTVIKSGEVWVDLEIKKRYQLSLGDVIQIGGKDFVIGDFIESELDRGVAFMNFSPRVMMSSDDLFKLDLLGIGSRATYRLLVAGAVNDTHANVKRQVDSFLEWSQQRIKDSKLQGLKIESIETGQPLMRKILERADRFLSLVALLTTMIAAVGIILTSQRYVYRQQITTSVWRVFGATQRQIIWEQLKLFFWMIVFSGLAGALLGWFAQELLSLALTQLIGRELPPPSLWPIIWAEITAVVLFVGFIFPPLMSLLYVSVIDSIRGKIGFLNSNLWITVFLGVSGMALLLFLGTKDAYLTALVLGAELGCVGVFFALTFATSKHLPRILLRINTYPKAIGFSLQKIAGSPIQNAIQATALGIALMSFLILLSLQFNVLEAWQASIPTNAPNRFLINIQSDQKAELIHQLEDKLKSQEFDFYPMVRGRLVKLNQQEITSSDFKDDAAARLIDREFNLSYTNQLPMRNKIVEGKWFAESNQANEISIEAGIMKSLHLKLGDDLTFDVAGEKFNMKITSVRSLDWNSMRVNFFAISPPQLLRDAPQSWILAFRQPESSAIDYELVEAFPNITIVNVQETLKQVKDSLNSLTRALAVLFGFAMVAGIFVLTVVTLTTQNQRIRQAAILKTMGADRKFLMRAWLFELSYIGTLAGGIAGAVSSLVAWLIASYSFEIDMRVPLWLIPMGILFGVLSSLIASYWIKAKVMSVSPLEILQSTH